MRAMVNRVYHNLSFVKRLAALRAPHFTKYGFEFLESLVKFLCVADLHCAVGDAIGSDCEHNQFGSSFLNELLDKFDAVALILPGVTSPVFREKGMHRRNMTNIIHRTAHCAKYWFHRFISLFDSQDYKPDVRFLSSTNFQAVPA
jgi:hypothetical protein